MKPIVLIGMMASGKTSIGKKLARELDMQWIDTDRLIEKQENMKIVELFETKGERYFRQRENIVLRKCLQQYDVISTGGGIIVCESNRRLLQQYATVIYLRTNIDTLVKRVDIKNRPLLQNQNIEQKLTILLNQRQMHYENVATIIIDTDQYTMKQLIQKIASLVSTQKK